jgi:hypothetical protein
MVGQRVHHRAGPARIASAGSDPWLDCEAIGSPDLARKGRSRRHQTEESVETHRGRWMTASSRLCSRVVLEIGKDRACQRLLRPSFCWTLPSLIFLSATSVSTGPFRDRRNCNYIHRRCAGPSQGEMLDRTVTNGVFKPIRV